MDKKFGGKIRDLGGGFCYLSLVPLIICFPKGETEENSQSKEGKVLSRKCFQIYFFI